MRSLALTLHHYIIFAMKVAIVLLFAIMIIVGFGQVVFRYVFGIAYAWASELTQFSMVWLCFLGAALLTLEEGHTNVDFFLNLLPRPIRLPLYVVSELILTAFIVSLIYYFMPTWKVDLRTFTPGLEIPVGWVTGSAILGLALTALYTVFRLIRTATQEK